MTMAKKLSKLLLDKWAGLGGCNCSSLQAFAEQAKRIERQNTRYRKRIKELKELVVFATKNPL